MRARSQLSTVLAVSAASALLAGGIASAAPHHPASGTREILASTAPMPGQRSALSALAPTSHVHVSVFIGRDPSGLAALAKAVSDPASPRYGHYLTPAQVQADFGATAAQQQAVANWLHGSGLTVTRRDAFTISATGTTAQAEAALQARLELSRPTGSTEQVVSTQAMSAPAAVASVISTVRVAPGTIPMGVHNPLRPATAQADKTSCSSYYGQKPAKTLPPPYGQQLTWSVCGYLPQQLRSAYGATKAGLTGQGASIAIMSEDNDLGTGLSDTDHWARDRHFPQLEPGQFTTHIANGTPTGYGDGEDALDIEAAYGMAPGATISYVAGNGTITGDRLLDSLDTIVAYHLADVVTTSWYEGSSATQSMIDAWESVLQRAAVEGITVNTASGDTGGLGLQYPTGDPWITAVGGTSIAIGAHGQRLWETGWATDETWLRKNGTWNSLPGLFIGGTSGGVSRIFPEPYYQDGIVSHNTIKGQAMRVAPDVSDLGDWYLGYQIGLTITLPHHKLRYVNGSNGGTSLASPLFAGLEADLIQARGGIALGFANPALYDQAGTSAFYDPTSDPQGQGVTEAVALGPASSPSLSTMAQFASAHLTCGPGYDTASGIGSPGPAFFTSFAPHPK